MSLALGIHCGHHAACALVRDGVLVAAAQQERFTRLKADGQEFLSNLLPLDGCLRAAAAQLSDVDIIVSSFQAASPGGIGLHRPLVERGFNLFDPLDERHFVVSHHFAHALSAFGSSGLSDAAALVCDLGGSTTTDGQDFMLSFGAFKESVRFLNSDQSVRTECLSIYDIDQQTVRLIERDFCIPHNAPDVFVSNAASLFDNVSRAIFRKENAHGQLMALSSLVDRLSGPKIDWHQMLDGNAGKIGFRNDWQYGMEIDTDELDSVPLARATQLALQSCLKTYARRARKLTRSDNLVVAGGSFLNIVANSELIDAGLFGRLFVPSSPHDAGVAVGCAFAGWRTIRSGTGIEAGSEADDRLGLTYSVAEIDDAILKAGIQTSSLEVVTPREIAELLCRGVIVARFSGRSEFGPRALGGRSLLASPLFMETKDRLNRIKGRQSWRPVAPIVLEERVAEFFHGPHRSRYMSFVHYVRPEFRNQLAALFHPDNSTRAQTLTRKEDAFLYEVIEQFAELTTFPILVNTSFNGRNEPIVETPGDALDFFLSSPEIDCLLFEDRLLRQHPIPSWKNSRLAPDVIVTFLQVQGQHRVLMIRGPVSFEISLRAFDRLLTRMTVPPPDSLDEDLNIECELQEAARLRLLIPVQGCN